jgi:DNA-binding LacI/PurR family transcriptional regulator
MKNNPGGSLVTIEDVARLAGVSNSTVSRVLNKKEYVKESTREKVFNAVGELGYKPSRIARSLRANVSQIIGLIISDIQNPFFTSLVRAVEDVAYSHNYSLLLCNTDEDPEKEKLYVELMLSERVSGVIITPTREYDCPVQKLLEMHIATVCVDRQVLDCETDSVVSDNVESSFKLVEHLIDHGHQRIGALFGPSDITTFRERLTGYRDAHSQYDLPVDESLIAQGIPKELEGYELANQLLDLPEPPTAIIAGNNLMALGAIHAIKDRKLSLPGDISIVSFDDREWAQLITPTITVASQPTYEMGREAAELVMRRLENEDSPVEHVVLESEIIFRESVRSII